MEGIIEIQDKIYQIRGVRVMLDFDLAQLYQVETRTLKQAVRRNIERFPDDFLVKLPEVEFKSLINSGVSQIVIPHGYNTGGHDVFAFTEQGVAMLSSVLKSTYAIGVNIGIMRAFVAMRNFVMSTKLMEVELSELKAKLILLEERSEENLEAVNDLSEDVRHEIDNIYDALAALSVKIDPPKPEPPRNKIGFKVGADHRDTK